MNEPIAERWFDVVKFERGGGCEILESEINENNSKRD
jgi:hypothetical protein